jgi:NADH-quinone oxidoreductase subunit N
MIETPHIDWLGLGPVLAPLGGGVVALLAAVFVRDRWRRATAALLVALGLAAGMALAGWLYAETTAGSDVIADSMRRDRLVALAQIVILASALVTVGISWSARLGEHVGEYFVLLATAAAGMAFFVSANDLIVLFLALEWFSLSLYIMCAILGDRIPSLEAGLKYLVVGSFGSAILLFGSALVFGATGEVGFGAIAEAAGDAGVAGDPFLLAGLAMVLAGLAFKVSAAPFHMWTPDVYEGAPTSVTAFMSAATKVAALVLTLRILATAFAEHTEFWTVAVATLVVASLAIGNLAAIAQRNLKRMLAYSSISHAGFMLIGVAVNNELGTRALLYYLIPYAAASLGAFAVVAARERELQGEVGLDELAGFGWERPLLGVSLWVFMLSFAGLPLTGGFFGKLLVFAAAVERGWIWLVIVGIAATVVSLYYYLGVVRALYMRPPGALRAVPVGGSPPRDAMLQTTVLLCLVVTVGSFFAVQPLVDFAREAAAMLPR